MAGAFSAVAATYGSRVEQLLETEEDYKRYHDKLNKKLRKLRHQLGLITKDTKNYSAKEKYSGLGSEFYDNENKLIAVLMLLHIERDMSIVEAIKLRSSKRGKLKKSERKLLTIRLKKAVDTSSRLVKVTSNESLWISRLQFLIVEKLINVENYIYGKHIKTKNSGQITANLSLVLVAIDFLSKKDLLSMAVCDYLKTKYEYTLNQHSGSNFNQSHLVNVMNKEVQKNADDELVKILLANGFKQLEDVEMAEESSSDEIQWRNFNAKINDSQVSQLISEAQSMKVVSVNDYDNILLKWQDSLNRQEAYMTFNEGHDDTNENDQIVLAYIKFHSLFTSISRDNHFFNKLIKRWEDMSKKSMSSKLVKYKEIERLVKNLIKYLVDVMELPGIYSDEQLMNQLELLKCYYTSQLNSHCLSRLYQENGKYLHALALHVDSLQKLEQALMETGDLNEIYIPDHILVEEKVKALYDLIQKSWSSIVGLAEYEKSLNKTSKNKSKTNESLIERIDTQRIKPGNVDLNNLFPMRPIIRPVGSKPTLFDLGFNYITYENETNTTSEQQKSIETKSDASSQNEAEQVSSIEQPKKRKFLGLFGR
ncbi:hypothetical protein Kpol_1060p28 [Vanderwaltozyma polyspora DSM 70294]|uniref:Signal recognition particle subunit SRP68 n=1 Tax=Vanderwaltozyma polyspora (strain ATCC 22028 / DSM 70294 / BCRC 21397 / CBS 2163 / NBRC 10782 / NRRL Y-8283 / UCD 57-17) TaxID=436907 RepID=A7TK26_VANPO|nr:uncharacterized protein Kpol_1060p28 [Vanderwaltozyma polyspora DSM 70294]EDO17372.1 hypothetical protein Kpol_1060p28 [Vanderwaltozyma polyspora DSM 70294]